MELMRTNPFEYIEGETDIIKVATAILQSQFADESNASPWEAMEVQLLASIMHFVRKKYPLKKQNMSAVMRVLEKEFVLAENPIAETPLFALYQEENVGKKRTEFMVTYEKFVDAVQSVSSPKARLSVIIGLKMKLLTYM